MKSGVFDKKAFIQSVRDNLKNLYRKTLEEADQQEIFQAVSFAVKGMSSMTDGLQHSRYLTRKIQRSCTTCRWNF